MYLPVITGLHNIDTVIFVDCLAVKHDTIPIHRHCLDDTGIFSEGTSERMAWHS